MKIQDLKINNELLNLIPRPEAQSRNLLIEAIKVEGMREPIVATYLNGELVVIDGHTRLTIAKELGWEDIEVNIDEFIKDDFEAIKERMMLIQLSRRNLTRPQYGYFIGQLYFDDGTDVEIIAGKVKQSQKNSIIKYLDEIARDVGDMTMMPQYLDTGRSIQVIRTQPRNVKVHIDSTNNSHLKVSDSNPHICPAYLRFSFINESGFTIWSTDGTYGNPVSSYKVLAWDVNEFLLKTLMDLYRCNRNEVGLYHSIR